MQSPGGVILRPGTLDDADAIARIMRAALASFDWMPMLHTPDEDRAFIRGRGLANQVVTVAEVDGKPVGFIAVEGEWVEQLYLDPAWTDRGIGTMLLSTATASLPVVRLHCFQANSGARRFYERHGFRAEAFRDGSANEEGLPDIRYLRSI
jgi:ribosomal protein S18 acetylase RimI-like enzyme